jgi:hypothetical protein
MVGTDSLIGGAYKFALTPDSVQDRNRPVRWIMLVLLVVAGAPRTASADKNECLRALDELGVEYSRAKRKGIRIGVKVEGKLGGVEYRAYNGKPLVLDCSLVYSLAVSGRFLRAATVERVTFSSAYQIRKIRGTSRPSKHSYGLAIDMHTFHTTDYGALSVTDDYEQGLGDNVDCIGQPLTVGGAVLKRVDCQVTRSQLYRIILTPDYDAGHYNHFHVEALPWGEREDVRAATVDK